MIATCIFLQATKKYDDGMSDDTSGSDFDDEEDPDKIEVPGKYELTHCIHMSLIVKYLKNLHFAQYSAITRIKF